MPFNKVTFESQALHGAVDYLISVPDGDGPFPTLYLHHGLGDLLEAGRDRTNIEDFLQGKDLIVVLPYAHTSWGANDPRDELAWETFLGEELIAEVDLHFPTIKEPSGRTQSGFSMGGYVAMMLAFRHAERFSRVYPIAGSYAFGHELRPDRPARSEFMMAVAPPDGPYDLFRLAEERAKDANPLQIRFEVGLQDHLLDVNRRFHARLTETGVEHAYAEFEGEGHRWSFVSNRLSEIIAFAMG